MFHISKTFQKKIKPNIPKNNYYISLGIENSSIPRISCSNSIKNCLKGLANKINTGDLLYVYNINSNKILSNNEIIKNKYIPFAKYTNEYWILEEVIPEYICKIKIKNKIKNKIVKQKFCSNFLMREIIEWDYEIIKEKKCLK